MCGIVALFTRDPRLLARVPVMTSTIRHRGPDDEGFVILGGPAPLTRGGKDTPESSYAAALPYAPQAPWDDASPEGACAVLGHRRLAILDLSPAGHQPMSAEQGRLWITFNGEIYNFLELRAELETLGHRFHTGTDTEVVLAAYLAWGPACLRRFQGMWALVIVDLAERRVFAARDPFGIKPLYLTAFDGGVAMASEAKALLDLPVVSRAVNPALLADFLYSDRCDHTPETLFAAIHQLPAGHYMTFALDEPHLPRSTVYWQLDLTARLELSFIEATERLQALFLDSMRLHLRSDVPIGSAVSGGIDSASTVGAIRHLAGPDMVLHAFSYVADDAALSEEAWIDIVTADTRAKIHKVHPQPGEFSRDMEMLVYHQDVPFAGSSIYAQHRVFQAAKEAGVTVMLDGQGADEMLAGYVSYIPYRLLDLLRQGRLLEAWRQWGASMHLPAGSYIARQTVRELLPAAVMGLWDRTQGYSATPAWLDVAWFAARGVRIGGPLGIPRAEGLRPQLAQSLTQTILPALLRYEDRNSMAHSVESRVPFLLPALAEFCFAIPENHLLSPTAETKSVFRAAMRGIVPDVILDRKDKIGFGTPEKAWLVQEHRWVEATLGGATARSIPVLNVPAMLADWQAMVAGQRAYNSRVWRWLNLIIWSQRFAVVYD